MQYLLLHSLLASLLLRQPAQATRALRKSISRVALSRAPDEENHHVIFCNLYASERDVTVFYAPYFGRRGDEFRRKLVEKAPYGECRLSIEMHPTQLQVNNFDRGSLWFEDEAAYQPNVPGFLKLGYAKYDVGHDPKPHWIVVFLTRKSTLDFRTQVLVQHVPKSATETYVPLLFRDAYRGVAERSTMIRDSSNRHIPMTHTAFAVPPGKGDAWEAYDGTKRVTQRFPADQGDLVIMMLIGNEPHQKNYDAHYYPLDLRGWSLNQGMLLWGHCSCRATDTACCQGKCAGVSCGMHGDCDPAQGACKCDKGWEGEKCEQKITTPPPPTTKPPPGAPPAPPTTTTTTPVPTPRPFCADGDDTCGDHGVCIDGECVCDEGWSGQYCDLPLTPPSPAPGAGPAQAPSPPVNQSVPPLPFPNADKPYPVADEEEKIPLPFPSMNHSGGASTTEEDYVRDEPASPPGDNYVPLPFPDFDKEPAAANTTEPFAPVPYESLPDEEQGKTLEAEECLEECAPHGRCGPDAKCICDENWKGASCDDKVEPKGLEPPVTDQCIGVKCSGHGVCRETPSGPVCDCDPGWTGSDCSAQYAPPGEEKMSEGPITEDWNDEAGGNLPKEKPASAEPFNLWDSWWWLVILLILLCTCCGACGAAAGGTASGGA